MSKVRVGITRALVAQGYASLFVFGFIDNARGPYFPEITRDLALSDTRASWFFATTSLLALVGSHFTAKLITHVSLQIAIRVGLMLLGLSLFGLTFVNTFWQMILVTALMGVFFGLINVTQNLCIQFGASAEHRPRLFSGLHSMYAASSLLAPLAITYLSAQGLDWRIGFRAFAGIIFATGALSFLLRSKPVYENKKSLAGSTEPEAAIFKNWRIMALSFCMAFYVAGELSLSSRLVLYLRRTLEYSPERASMYLSIFFAFLFIGRAGSALVRYRTKTLPIIIFCSLGLSLAFYAAGLAVDPKFLTIAGLTMAPFFGVFLAHLGNVLHAQVVKAMAFALAAGTLTVVPMHFGIGLLSDAFGLQKALWVGPSCLLISLGLFLYFEVRHAHGK